jgi:hypothetical protein
MKLLSKNKIRGISGSRINFSEHGVMLMQDTKIASTPLQRPAASGQ